MQSKILSRSDLEFLSKWELPKVQPQLDLLASIDTTTRDMQDAWF
jgi:hypothetical protein